MTGDMTGRKNYLFKTNYSVTQNHYRTKVLLYETN